MSVPSWRRWICPFLFLWLLYLKELTGREMKQYIVSFNVSLNQYEQKKYLSEQFQQDSFDFVFRMYISREIPSDFAVVKLTDADQGEWLVSLSSSPPSLIIGIYEDSLESRQLLGSNGKHGGEDDAFLDFQPSSLTSSFSADGVRGQGVKVAVFDTGLTRGHPAFMHRQYERTDWTNEGELDDFVGHGTFVAGVIAGRAQDCPGMAQDVELHVFRIFNKSQKAYTSWFLDAFNYAIYLGVDVVNLSIGGPDYGDTPFVDKIDEMAANGMIVVSAVGNDGPVWGSLHNPADQNSVIGVGGWRGRGHGHGRGREEKENHHPAGSVSHESSVGPGGEVAPFSSRGMTLWNSRPRVKTSLPSAGPDGQSRSSSGGNGGNGGGGGDDEMSGASAVNSLSMGRVKPDLLAPSFKLLSATHVPPFACRTMSGTSVANPIVAAGIALLLSSVAHLPQKRASVSNVAAMKQILMSTANRVDGFSIFEQGKRCGSGLLNLTAAHASLPRHSPHVSAIPPHISNFDQDCPYLWPWCGQQLFASSQPFIATFTLLNSISSTGHVARIQWIESSRLGMSTDDISFKISADESPDNDPRSMFVVSLRSRLLTVRLQSQRVHWPWTGSVEALVSVNEGSEARAFRGEVTCKLLVTLQPSYPGRRDNAGEGDNDERVRTAEMSLSLKISPAPPRRRRILWDVFHSISFPSAFVPNDNPGDARTKLDLLGDHPFTNYREAYLKLQRLGYTVELLRKPWTCFDASLYSVLILCDLEDDLAPQEIVKLEDDVRAEGLSVLVIADWFDEIALVEGAINDDNTHSRWFPITGGSNVPSMNKLLKQFGIQLGLQSFKGSIKYENSEVQMQTGNTIAAWPAGGYLWRSRAGDLTPLLGGHLRAQFGPRQPFAGFLQVQDDEEDDDDDEDDEDVMSKRYTNDEDIISLRDEGNVTGGRYGAGGRIVAVGDSAFVDMSSYEEAENSMYGSLKLLEVLVEYLVDGGEAEGSPPLAPGWSSYPELLTKVYHDPRLAAAFSSYSTVSVDKLDREAVLRRRELMRYSRLFDDEGAAYPVEDFCEAF